MALIKTTAEFKKYIIVNASINIDTLNVFLDQATTLFIEDLLGTEQLNTLQTYVDADSTPTDADLDSLLPYVKKVLTYYSMYLGVDQLAVNVGDAGIVEQSSQNSNPAPSEKLEALRNHYLNYGDLHAEKLLEYLEKNASVSKYSEWFTSAAATTSKGLILSNAIQCDEYIDINQSRRLFRRLKKRVSQIENNYISLLIGATQYNSIVSKIEDESILTDDPLKLLVTYLRPIIAKMALYETLPFLKIKVTAEGVDVVSNSGAKAIAASSEVNSIRKSLKEGETGFESDIDRLKTFIVNNISDYPDIASSTAYTSRPDPGPKRPPVNSPDTKHFSV